MVLPLMLACVDGPGATPVDAPDALGTFQTYAQPVFEARCANPACHGSVDRPLEVYAVGQHRLDEADRHRQDGLTERELSLNLWRAWSFVGETAATSELLLKPLDPESGGHEHQGGVIWHDLDAFEAAQLTAWIEGSLP